MDDVVYQRPDPFLDGLNKVMIMSEWIFQILAHIFFVLVVVRALRTGRQTVPVETEGAIHLLDDL